MTRSGHIHSNIQAIKWDFFNHPWEGSLRPILVAVLLKTLLSRNDRTIPFCDPVVFGIQQPFDDFGVGLNGGSLASPTIRILVVDDLEAWRQRIRSMLQTRPELCVVAEAADGLEAIQKAQE